MAGPGPSRCRQEPLESKGQAVGRRDAAGGRLPAPPHSAGGAPSTPAGPGGGCERGCRSCPRPLLAMRTTCCPRDTESPQETAPRRRRQPRPCGAGKSQAPWEVPGDLAPCSCWDVRASFYKRKHSQHSPRDGGGGVHRPVHKCSQQLCNLSKLGWWVSKPGCLPTGKCCSAGKGGILGEESALQRLPTF